MRRFLPAAVIALLALAAATPVRAGYLVIQIVLDGSGAGGAGAAAGGEGAGAGTGVPPGTPAPHDPSRSLFVVVPVEYFSSDPLTFYSLAFHRTLAGPNNPNPANPVWEGGKLQGALRDEKFAVNLFTDSSTILWYKELLATPGPQSTRVTVARDDYARWAKTKPDPKKPDPRAKPDPKLLFAALKSALEARAIDSAVAYADELLAFADQNKADLPPNVVAFAAAWGKMQKAVKGVPTAAAPADRWKDRLDTQNVHFQGHYALIYWDARAEEVKRRMTVLEENFKGFYLWHALIGVELPVPAAPLVAVLPPEPGRVRPLVRNLDGPPVLPVDGHYTPDHDLLVLSPTRTDDVGRTFQRQMQQMYQSGLSPELLLSGGGPEVVDPGKADPKGGAGDPPRIDPKKADAKKAAWTTHQVAEMQTKALVERLADDTSAVAAATREGTRQLLYATGHLPRYVNLPEWVGSGAVNFFARPRDPAFIPAGPGKWIAHVAPDTGFGGPNPTLQRYFKEFYGDIYKNLTETKKPNPDEHKALTAARVALLRNILSDAYFLGLRDPRDANDPDPIKADAAGVAQGTGTGQTGPKVQPAPATEDPAAALRKKRERLSAKAQATSWALYYYLVKNRRAELTKFLAELAAQPRDLPLDADTVTAAFCRAFCRDASREALADFAEAWLKEIASLSPAGVDVTLTAPVVPKSGNTGGAAINPKGG